jgi:hypothetical protein
MKHRFARGRGFGWLAWLLVLLAAGPATAGPGTVELSHRASVSIEYDDNVYKTHRDLVADGLGRLFYDFGLNWYITPNNLWQTNYQLGGKAYFQETDKDALINQLQLGFTNSSVPMLQLGVDAAAKLRNTLDSEEDYLKYQGRAFAGVRPVEAFYLELHAAYDEFDLRQSTLYDYWNQQYGLEMRCDYQRIFSIGVNYDFNRKTYYYNANRNIGGGAPILEPTTYRRADNLHEAGLSFSYQTTLFESLPFLATAAYLYQYNDSNSYGNSFDNHRLLLSLSQYVHQDTSVHLLGTVQIRNGKEKVLLAPNYAVEETDDNYNQLAVRLNHDFTDNIGIFGGYHRYWSSYPDDQFNFEKNLYTVGAKFSF